MWSLRHQEVKSNRYMMRINKFIYCKLIQYVSFKCSMHRQRVGKLLIITNNNNSDCSEEYIESLAQFDYDYNVMKYLIHSTN